MRGRVARFAFERGALLGLAVLALYAFLAPGHVVDGDNAELSTLAALGGAAHPPGYPLYVMWLRVWSWLPGTPAHAAALATAVLAAASIVVLHAACRAWGARPLAATLACAVFAAAPVVVALSSQAEVFAMNDLACAAILLASAARGPWRGGRRLLALGLIAGLGLANHPTCALLAPVGVLGFVRGVREASWRHAPLVLAGLVLGLAPYAYLVVAPVHAGSWGDIRGPGDVLAMFLRRDYGGPGAFATTGHAVGAGASLGALAATVGRTWLWAGALAGLAAAVARLVRPVPDGEPRAGWATLLASLVIAGPVLAARFNVPPEGLGLFVVRRFHVLPALLLAIPVAAALDRAGTWLAPRVRALSPALAGALGVLAFPAVASAALPYVLRAHSPAVMEQVRGTLDSLPEHALVYGTDDDLLFVTHYLQLVEHDRTDVGYAHAPLLGRPWYRARLAAAGIPVSDDDLVGAALATGRPVFVHPNLFAAVGRRASYPYGILLRVLPPGTPPPSLADVVAENERLFASFSIAPEPPRTGDGWLAAVYRRYARTWHVLARLLAASGDRAGAAHAEGIAQQLEPRP